MTGRPTKRAADEAGGATSLSGATSLNDRAGMREVAARAGVAMSSVSRVLSGHPDVSQPMRDRVEAAVAELGYERNMLAQMLRRGASQTVGFVVGDISNPLLAQIALGAETALRAAGYAMVLTNSGHEANMDATHIRLLQGRRVDGLLLSLSDESSPQTIEALRKAAIPSVLIDRELSLDEPASAVLSDHASGISDAVRALVGLGHQRIALVTGSPHVRPTRERIAAIEEAVEDNPGVVCKVRAGAYTESHGKAATQDLFSGRRPPTAIIAGGNQILVGVLSAVTELGLRIPRDISLITCDDVPLAKFLTPGLALIDRNPHQMGTVAAGLLLDRLAGGEPESVTLPTTFTTAGSCARPADTTPRKRLEATP